MDVYQLALYVRATLASQTASPLHFFFYKLTSPTDDVSL